MSEGKSNEEGGGLHPSKSLASRSSGFGIGGGFERPIRKGIGVVARARGVYGTVPPCGYYGGGEGQMPFEFGKAGFGCELNLYPDQYGRESVSAIEKS